MRLSSSTNVSVHGRATIRKKSSLEQVCVQRSYNCKLHPHTADSLQPPFYLCAGKRITQAEIKRLSSLKCTATKWSKADLKNQEKSRKVKMVFPLLDINMQYIDAMPCAHFGPVHPFELNNSELSLHSYNIQPLTIPVPAKHNNKQIWPPVHKTI